MALMSEIARRIGDHWVTIAIIGSVLGGIWLLGWRLQRAENERRKATPPTTEE